MEYNQLTNLQFEEIMEGLLGKPVWLEVKTETVIVNVLYDGFEFLSFVNGKYQFGFENYDEENEYKNLLINQSDILDIHRNSFAPSMNAEQIVLSMIDFTEIFVEYNY